MFLYKNIMSIERARSVRVKSVTEFRALLHYKMSRGILLFDTPGLDHNDVYGH